MSNLTVTATNDSNAIKLRNKKSITLNKLTKVIVEDGLCIVFDYSDFGDKNVFHRYIPTRQSALLDKGSKIQSIGDSKLTLLIPAQHTEIPSIEAKRRRMYAYGKVAERVEFELKEIASYYRFNNHPSGVMLNITRQTIASIVGCSREMLKGIDSKLEQSGFCKWEGSQLIIYRDKDDYASLRQSDKSVTDTLTARMGW